MKKKQTGGFGIDPSIANLLSVLDKDKINFNDIAGLGAQLGGANPFPWLTAINTDDPTKYTDSIIRGTSIQNAATTNPVTPEAISQEAYNMASTALYAPNGNINSPMAQNLRNLPPHVRLQIENEARRQFQDEAAQTLQNNQATATTENVTNTQNTFGDLSGLFGLFSALGNFENGGFVNKTGYTDNAPTAGNPYNVIPSNVITMDKTSIPLLAIPNNGTPQVLDPLSGTHVFPNANSVMEIPLMKKGGKKKKKLNYYQDGGNPVPVAVQLEKDEIIATPQLDILDTAARKSHDQLAKDIVTDIIRPDDYVFSDKNKITLKDAENISFGLGAMLYEEGKIPSMPEEQLASSLFKEGETEMPIAEYVKRVRKKFPITDKEDIFSVRTNEFNKAARLPFIAAATYVNELKRTKGKGNISSFAPTFVNKFQDSKGAMAGKDMSGAISTTALPTEVPEGQDGGFLNSLNPIGAGIQLATGLFDAFIGAPKRKRIALNALREDRTNIDELAASQRGFSGLSTLAGVAGVVNQDPTVTAPQYDLTQFNQRIRRVPQSLYDFAAGKLMSQSIPAQNAIFNNAGSYSQAVNAYAPLHSSNVSGIASLAADMAAKNIELENQYRDLGQGYSDRQTAADTSALNATRANTNQLTAGLYGNLAAGINSQGNIEANRLNSLRQNDLQQAQTRINANAQGTQSFYNLGENVANFGTTLQPYLTPRAATPSTPSVAPPVFPQTSLDTSILRSPIQPLPQNPNQILGGQVVLPMQSYRPMEYLPTPQTGFIYDPVTGQRYWGG